MGGKGFNFFESSSNTHPRCRADDGQVPSDKKRTSEGVLMAGPLDSSEGGKERMEGEKDGRTEGRREEQVPLGEKA